MTSATPRLRIGETKPINLTIEGFNKYLEKHGMQNSTDKARTDMYVRYIDELRRNV